MMKLLRLRLLTTGYYRIVVHLDATRLGGDGEPDQVYVLPFAWPPKPDGMTHVAYLQQERPLIRAFCVARLAEIEAAEGAALPGEGDPL